MLEQIWKLLVSVPEVDHRILVTTSRPVDDELAEKARGVGFEVFRGDVSNVYSRFQKVCDIYNLDVLLRFTGDNPLIDTKIVGKSISYFLNSYQNGEPAFLSTRNTFMPVGMDIEMFSKEVLSLDPKNLTPYDEEHVTPWMYSDARVIKLEFLANLPKAGCSVTVDTPEELIVADKIFEWLENRAPSFELVKLFFETQY
jgi:spore coat polysaccharide biosynthesis protein SpsF